MRNKLTIAKLYANAYGHRAAQTVKNNADKAVEVVSENKKELTILTATSSVVYLASRVAGFKAGYAFAKTPAAN